MADNLWLMPKKEMLRDCLFFGEIHLQFPEDVLKAEELVKEGFLSLMRTVYEYTPNVKTYILTPTGKLYASCL